MTDSQKKQAPVDVQTTCWGCGKWSTTLYCEECFKEAKCSHDKKIEDCDTCYVAGDLAFDAGRERGR